MNIPDKEPFFQKTNNQPLKTFCILSFLTIQTLCYFTLSYLSNSLTLLLLSFLTISKLSSHFVSTVFPIWFSDHNTLFNLIATLLLSSLNLVTCAWTIHFSYTHIINPNSLTVHSVIVLIVGSSGIILNIFLQAKTGHYLLVQKNIFILDLLFCIDIVFLGIILEIISNKELIDIINAIFMTVCAMFYSVGILFKAVEIMSRCENDDLYDDVQEMFEKV